MANRPYRIKCRILILNWYNLRKHGIDFLDVPAVFNGLIVTVEDDRFDYGEERFVTAECGQRRLRRLLVRVPWRMKHPQGRTAFTAEYR